MRIAEIARSKRECQIAESEWNIADADGGKILLMDYIKKEKDFQSKKKYPYKLYKKLEKYKFGRIQLMRT